MKKIFILLFILYGCSNKSEIQIKGTGIKNYGLYIENSQRYGSVYNDSTKKEFFYIYLKSAEN